MKKDAQLSLYIAIKVQLRMESNVILLKKKNIEYNRLRDILKYVKFVTKRKKVFKLLYSLTKSFLNYDMV